MPSSVASAALFYALVLAVVGATLAPILLGCVAVLWECFLFYNAGRR